MSTTTTPRTAAEISARISEIGETLARAGIAETLPNHRALLAEREELRARYVPALEAESATPAQP